MSSIDVEAAVRTFRDATESKTTIQLLDVAYDEFVAALDWGNGAILAKQGVDLVYLVVAALADEGIPFNDVFAAVHTSNMSRVGTDGKVLRDDDGKIVKGKDYIDPDKAIKEILGT
jgi:predicted HAD superfamily Cof-like phosphohydrolase